MLARLMTWTGAIGSALAAACCVTGLLPFLLGILGLGSLTGALYRDSVLLPALAVFLTLTGAGLWLKRRKSHSPRP